MGVSQLLGARARAAPQVIVYAYVCRTCMDMDKPNFLHPA